MFNPHLTRSHDPFLVILFYDHALTFKDEYRYIWQKPRSGASVLFLLNRYFALISVSVTSVLRVIACMELKII